MKLNVGDKVVIKSEQFSGSALVEDASKGDIIMAKVMEVEAGDVPGYALGKVYSFNRKDIVD
jgi:hypothetical protein